MFEEFPILHLFVEAYLWYCKNILWWNIWTLTWKEAMWSSSKSYDLFFYYYHLGTSWQKSCFMWLFSKLNICKAWRWDTVRTLQHIWFHLNPTAWDKWLGWRRRPQDTDRSYCSCPLPTTRLHSADTYCHPSIQIPLISSLHMLTVRRPNLLCHFAIPRFL